MKPSDQLSSGLHDIIVALESLPPSTGYRVAGAISKMASLRDRAPMTFQVLCIWITRYSGIWPWGATKDVALEMGVSERAIHKRLVRIAEDPLFNSFLTWRDDGSSEDAVEREPEAAPEVSNVKTVASLAREHNVSRVTVYAWLRKGRIAKEVYTNGKNGP